MTNIGSTRKAVYNQARHEAHLAARRILLTCARSPGTVIPRSDLRALLCPDQIDLGHFPAEHRDTSAAYGSARGMKDMLRTAVRFMVDDRLWVTPERVVDIYWALPPVSAALIIGCLSPALHGATEALAQFEYNLRPPEYAPFYMPDNIPFPIRPLVDYGYHLRETSGVYRVILVSHTHCTCGAERNKQVSILEERFRQIGMAVSRFRINDDTMTYEPIERIAAELELVCAAA